MEIKKDLYELKYVPSNNRIYFRVIGYWGSIEDVTDFWDDWKLIVSKTKPNFTILSDLMEMQPFPQDVADLNSDIQEWLMKNGLSGVAQVASNSICVEVNKMAKKSGLREVLRAFDDKGLAEYWLDEMENKKKILYKKHRLYHKFYNFNNKAIG